MKVDGILPNRSEENLPKRQTSDRTKISVGTRKFQLPPLKFSFIYFSNAALLITVNNLFHFWHFKHSNEVTNEVTN